MLHSSRITYIFLFKHKAIRHAKLILSPLYMQKLRLRVYATYSHNQLNRFEIFLMLNLLFLCIIIHCIIIYSFFFISTSPLHSTVL